MSKKKIWKWLAAMGTFAVLTNCQAVLKPYADDRFADQAEYLVHGPAECRRLLMEVGSSIRGRGRHEFYVTGEDYEPETLVLAQMFPGIVNISNTKLSESQESGHVRITCRIGFERAEERASCDHVWEREVLEEAACLQNGRERVFCSLCGDQEEVALAALGHVDDGGDSVCDRCGARYFAQQAGDRITVLYDSGEETRAMEFICVKESFGGGMLYAYEGADLTELLSSAGGPEEGTAEERIRWWLDTDFYNGISVGSACIGVELLDIRGDPVPEGKWQDGEGVRPGLVLKPPVVEEEPEKKSWSVGDIQIRTLGGIRCRFRCVDDDYGDNNSNYQKSALFLCETVIRSDVDSPDSQRETLPFGKINNYKTSSVRAWLSEKAEEENEDLLSVYTGVDSAFEGKTRDGAYGQLTGSGLVCHRLSYQHMTDRLFLLSLEEAIRYREELWDTKGAGSPYNRGYWLRTPVFSEDENGEFAYGTWEYVVDLEQGCIRPAEVTDGSIGIRPAFCLPQA